METVETYREQFVSQHFLTIPEFVSPDFVRAHYLPELMQCDAHVHRVHVGSFKKSGSVASHDVEKYAPALYAFYHLPALKKWIESIAGCTIYHCPKDDPHSVALYYYTEPGDHIGVHYDKSFYRGRRYTALLGLVQDSVASKLVCYPGATKLNRRANPIDIYTHPGTLVLFDGDTLWHEVTPLAQNEKRIILTMEFVTDTRMTLWNRFISHAKDRYLYFGNHKGK